jgi:SAM-dependent methyltransferase
VTVPPGGALAEGVLVQAMWTYAATVLRPAQLARQCGLAPAPTHTGTLPLATQQPGLGPRFSRIHARPVLKEAPSAHDHLVEEFDRMGEIYDAYVRPFSEPIMDEAVAFLGRYLRPDMRLMDAGCGSGREVCRFARLVPAGEVVGIDLAAGMVNAAHRTARAKGLDNTAFVQADIGALPDDFEGAFDLIYSSLAHHHYPEPAVSTRGIFRALRPGGLYAVIDAGPQWFNETAGPLAAWADPGWIGFHSPTAFDRLFADAGFHCRAWIDLLPGFGIALGQKPAM